MNKQLIGWLVGILILGGGGGLVGKSFTQQADIKHTKEQVKQLEVKTELTKEEIDDIEKIDIRQSMMIQQVTQTLEKLNTKIDKDLGSE